MPASALAQQTTNYSYDALGRLTGSAVASGANAGTQTAISYDAAGNRTQYAVTGSSRSSPVPSSVVVVPSGSGYAVIPIYRLTP